jgi:hypothetical protein
MHCCIAAMRAPHSTLACVHRTPFARDVVPVVKRIIAGASGSGARGGARSCISDAKLSSLAIDRAGGAPASVAVTAIHSRPAQLASASRRRGCVIAARAPDASTRSRVSGGVSAGFARTAMAPIHAQAKRAISVSGQFSS